MRYLKRNHSTASPGEVIAYNVTMIDESFPQTSGSQRLTAGDGFAYAWRNEKGRTTRHKQYELSTGDGLFYAIADRMSKHRKLWVIGYDVSAQLWASGLGRVLDLGEFKVYAEQEPGDDGQTRNEKSRSSPGLLVTADPPVIISLHHKSGAKVLLFDLRNWINEPIQTIRDMATNTGFSTHPAYLDICANCTGAQLDAASIALAFHMVVDWVRSNGLGMFRWTIAGQAMAAFRHRFMQRPIVLHENLPATNLEMASYYGGEFSVSQVGKIQERLNLIDARGFYPSVMFRHKFPYKLLEYREFGDNGREYVDCEPTASIATVKVCTPHATYPMRNREGIWHCSGDFITTLAGPELARAAKRGHVQRWYRLCEYATAPLFETFVSWGWSQRILAECGGDNVRATMAKLLLNSLYGKFAQRTPQWEYQPERIAMQRWGEWSEINADTREVIHLRGIAGQTEKMVARELANTAFPAIASFVTAWARVKMKELREICYPGTVYYQAADSLVVDDMSLRILRNLGYLKPNELGKWRLQHSSSGPNEINGINSCRLGDKIIQSGISGDAKKLQGLEWLDNRTESLNHMINRGPDMHAIRHRMHITWNKHSVRGSLAFGRLVTPWHLSYTGNSLSGWLSNVDSALAYSSANLANSSMVAGSMFSTERVTA